MGEKQKAVFNKDIGMYIAAHGFAAAKEHYGRTLTAARARDVIRAMKAAGITNIPQELADHADKIRRIGPRLPPPEIGDERPYRAAKNCRVSANMAPYGVGPGDVVIVKYKNEGVLMKPAGEKRKTKK